MDTKHQISFADAKQWVEARLNDSTNKNELVVDGAMQHQYGWCISYNTKQFVDTQDSNFALVGNLPYYVTFDGYAYRVPAGFAIKDIENFIQALQGHSREEREFRSFEARIPFKVEPEADTESVLQDARSNPDVFRRLEAQYCQAYAHCTGGRSSHQAFELSWSTE